MAVLIGSNKYPLTQKVADSYGGTAVSIIVRQHTFKSAERRDRERQEREDRKSFLDEVRDRVTGKTLCEEYIANADWGKMKERKNLTLISVYQNSDLVAVCMYDDQDKPEVSEYAIFKVDGKQVFFDKNKFAELVLLCARRNSKPRGFGRLALLVAFELMINGRKGKGIVLEQARHPDGEQTNRGADRLYDDLNIKLVEISGIETDQPYVVRSRNRMPKKEFISHLQKFETFLKNQQQAAPPANDSLPSSPAPQGNVPAVNPAPPAMVPAVNPAAPPAMVPAVNPADPPAMVPAVNPALPAVVPAVNPALPAIVPPDIPMPSDQNSEWSRFLTGDLIVDDNMNSQGGQRFGALDGLGHYLDTLDQASSQRGGNLPPGGSLPRGSQRGGILSTGGSLPRGSLPRGSLPRGSQRGANLSTGGSLPRGGNLPPGIVFDAPYRGSSPFAQNNSFPMIPHNNIPHNIIPLNIGDAALANVVSPVEVRRQSRPQDVRNAGIIPNPIAFKFPSSEGYWTQVYDWIVNSRSAFTHSENVIPIRKPMDELRRDKAHAPSGEYWCRMEQDDIWRVDRNDANRIFKLKDVDDPARGTSFPLRKNGNPRQCYDSGLHSAAGKPHAKLFGLGH
jgi:hypothetical protein